MGFAKSWVTSAALTATLLLGAACGKSPTGPTPPPPPPPPPPVADAPTLSCGESFTRTTTGNGLAISFDTPPVSGGQGSVTVSCSPQSGETFPIGTTSVTCKATDTLNRTGECSFNITVARLPTLSRTKYLAFGDSITAGEVTVPVGSLFGGAGLFSKQVVVPAASYPSVLLRTLQGRYSSQSPQFVVANYGVPGERAVDARNRFVQALNREQPEVVLLLHGHNDIPGGADGAASGAAREIDAMAAEARLRGLRMFIGTLSPARAGGTKPIAQPFIDDFNARLRVVAARQNATIVEIHDALRTDITRFVGVDGLHPTEAGYAKIADTFFQAIQNTFEVR